MNLKTRVKRLKAKIDLLQCELRIIQDHECEHPKKSLFYMAGSNTGNYDPSSDCYWLDFDCNICGKRWTTDQTRENRERGTEVKEKY